MDRKQLSIVMLSALLLIAIQNFVSTSLVDGSQTPSLQDPVIVEMISKMNESEIYNTVYKLQNFTTRRNGTAGNVDTRTYLYDRLSSIPRLDVGYQGGIYNNVIGTLNGTDKSSNAIFVVGGHYDSKVDSQDINSPAPGATDNAGGVAVVLELARIMSQYEFSHTIKFALFNAEEDGCYGSSWFADAVYRHNLNISFFLNFDASCYDPENRFILDIMSNNQSQWVSDMMTEYNTLYDMGFTLTYNVHDCTSDHVEFWNRGYTAVATHQETHGDFVHTINDTIDKVSTLYAKKNGQLGMSVLAKLAEVQDIKPPVVFILSPENKTYSDHDVPLIFTIDEVANWIGFGLDKQANRSITGNTTLLDLPDGLHTVTIYANGNAGNVGVSSAVYFTVDTTLPIGSITIADGAVYINSPSVTLTLTAEDVTSGIAVMRFSFDDTSWSSWEMYATHKAWVFTNGDGLKIVYVQFMDNAGLISFNNDSIILDTTEPTAEAGVDQSVNEDTLVTFDGSASTDENGIASFTWTFTEGKPQSLTGKNPTYTFATPGTYVVTLKVTDAAGNYATSTVTITVLPSVEAFPMWIVGATVVTIVALGIALYFLKIRKH